VTLLTALLTPARAMCVCSTHAVPLIARFSRLSFLRRRGWRAGSRACRRRHSREAQIETVPAFMSRRSAPRPLRGQDARTAPNHQHSIPLQHASTTTSAACWPWRASLHLLHDQARAGISGDAKHVQEYLCDYRTVVGTLPDRRFGFDILAIIGFRGESDELRIAKPASFYRAEYDIDGRSDGSEHTIV
jgi:hypothetical protein